MSPRREFACFAAVLALVLAGLLRESLAGGKVLSPADVLLVGASFRDVEGASDEPRNRLLIDAALQFQPWLELNREALRRGRLPLWNPFAGCGAPHLANAQSAVFDPFQLVAYLGTLPDALAWMAALRLWFAGIGMFLLGRHWGLGPWGRWFAGLTFPLCGFLIVWLLFPVTNAAIWMPWVVLTASRLLDRPGARRVGQHALCVGGCLLGGHIQTSAHVLLAAGGYAAWRLAGRPSPGVARGLSGWAAATLLGLGIGSVVAVPLGVYLTKSPVWSDRRREAPSVWEVPRPRFLDAACTAVPYLFGSQRRGHPNLAPALGVHNLNESAGGYAGLATLVWLAPGAWGSRRSRPVVGFLAGLAGVGFLGAFHFPPVSNLLRAIPVVDVIDARRMTLWVAFALAILGGVGLDRLARPGGRTWSSALAVTGLMLLSAAVALPSSRPWLESRARAHYDLAAREEPGADPATYRARAERQVSHTLTFLPRVLAAAGLELLAIAGLGAAVECGRLAPPAGRAAVLGLTLVELFLFADGMNPAIDRALDRPTSAVVARLRERLGPGERLIGIGQEFPPNAAMRHGLADARNYDSVELSRALDRFRALFEPDGGPLSSRSTVRWEGVLRAREVLRESVVAAVVSPTPPPPELAAEAEPVGSSWIAWLDARPLLTVEPPGAGLVSLTSYEPGRIALRAVLDRPARLVVRETYDEGWSAVDGGGRAAAVRPSGDAFMEMDLRPGTHALALSYDPVEVRLAVLLASGSLAAACSLAAARAPGASPILPEGLGAAETLGLKSCS